VTVLGRIIVAREALEVGDHSLAYDVLVDLEDDLAAGEPSSGRRKFRCGCGAAFRWPGALQHHQYASRHGALSMEEAA
jgi:hypothetical protein